MQYDISETPQFTDNMRRVEVGEPATAALFNMPVLNLLENTRYLKAQNEKLNEHLGKQVTGTLYTGDTTVTLTDSAITEDSTLDIYTDVYGVSPKTVSVTDGSVVMTFKAQDKNVDVKVVVK